MSSQTLRDKLITTSIISGCCALATPLLATAQSDVSDDIYRQQTVTVTGSRIPDTANLVATSPVTTLDNIEFSERGTLRVEDIINTLPQAFGAQGSSLANGASGTATINLRGLGEDRTLVLLNGRRLPYGSLRIVAPDVNFIPAALIERVDLLTGGASAAYGSDAVSGVVNFILDTDFEGLKLDTNYSFYQHNNSGELKPLLNEFTAINPTQFRVPSGSTTDGEAIDITAVFGGKIEDGRGHFTGYIGYQNVEPVLQGDRDYAQCALGTRSGGREFTCSGSSTNQFANILDVGGNYTIPGAASINSQTQTGWSRVNPANGTFEPRDFTTDTFNYNPFNHYQRPNERYNFGAFANYQINPSVEAYTELMFMDTRTNSQIAPSGVFGLGIGGDAGGITCGNAMLSQQQRDYLCGEIPDGIVDRYTVTDLNSPDFGLYTDENGVVLSDQTTFVPRFDGIPDQAALGANDIVPILILRRNVEGGERNNDIRHTSFRGVIGARGALGDTGLNYDVSASFANVIRTEVYNNDLSKRNIAKALNVVDDGAGNIACAVNVNADPADNDPNCVPYDIFSGNPPSQAAIAYITNPLNRNGETTQTIVSGQVDGDLGQYGWTLPMAEDGIRFAAGAEYRRDFLDSNPDANYQSGDGAGQGGPTNPIEGSLQVVDVFVEAKVPIVQNRTGIEALGVDLSYRRSFYDDNETDSYKFGVEYAPSDDIRFRGSYQRAVRAANVFELFLPQGIGLFDLAVGTNDLFDPCAGPAPAASLSECQRTGVTPGQYGSIADNPAGQFNKLEGGNPALEPETADTFTLGFVATPKWIDNLTISLDYFDIEVEDYINTVPENLSLQQCLATGDAFFCSLVQRGAGGTLWANNTGYITATNINTGAISTRGFDLLAQYAWQTHRYGDFKIDYVGTLIDALEVKPLPTSTGTDIFDCAGHYGGRCQTNFETGSNPEYRHKIGLNWSNGEKWSIATTWRHFSDVTLDASSDPNNINHQLDTQDYFDASTRYDWNEKVSLRAGINNIFDEDPPLSSVVGTAPGNGNTYPQVYDALGRYIFFGATINF